jgi:hypothetical protein
MVQYGQPQGGALVGTMPSQGVKSSGPTRRNALMTMLLPFAVILGGEIVFGILAALTGIYVLGLLGLLCALGGLAWFLVITIKMAGEIKAVTQNQGFAWWPILVPFYGMYWAWIVVPQEVAKAKQILRVQQSVRPIVVYIFLWHFALASDINDMVR